LSDRRGKLSLVVLQAGSAIIFGAELFAIGLLLFIIIYIVIRLLTERMEHLRHEKKEENENKGNGMEKREL
jgi:flagellar biosynthesis/type III secretory pathway M-ring protein FliF/YscJ